MKKSIIVNCIFSWQYRYCWNQIRKTLKYR